MSCWRGVQARRCEADAPEEEFAPLLKREGRSATDEGPERVPRRHLDRPNGFNAEGLTALFSCHGGHVLQCHLRVESAGQHALVLIHQFRGDVDVVELEAGQLGLVGVAAGIKSRAEEIDDLDPAPVASSMLE